MKVKVLVAQACLTLSDPKDCSLPGFSVHGTSQIRILEWVAVSSARGSFDPEIEPGSPTLQADSSPSEPPGKPNLMKLNPKPKEPLQHSAGSLFTLLKPPPPLKTLPTDSELGVQGAASSIILAEPINFRQALPHPHTSSSSFLEK